MVFALMLGFSLLIALEVPGLVKNKMWKELVVYSVLMAIGIAYSLCQVLDWPLPNPTKGVEIIFKPVAEAVDRLLK